MPEIMPRTEISKIGRTLFCFGPYRKSQMALIQDHNASPLPSAAQPIVDASGVNYTLEVASRPLHILLLQRGTIELPTRSRFWERPI